MNQHSTNRPPV